MSDDKQHRIRQRAHAIWEGQGRPDGQDRQHWAQATKEIEAEDAAVGKKPAAKAAPKAKTAPKATPKAAPAKKPVAKAKAKTAK